MSVLNHPLITGRYFFPRRLAVDDPTWVEVEHGRLACYASHRGHPVTIVFFHGNGEVVADYIPEWVELFDELGADCFFAEYRGYGESEGVPQLGKMLDDVGAIFEAVGRPPEDVIVMGRSVGSIYAIELAHRHPDVAGLVLESAIADPLERIMMRVTPEEMGTTLDLVEKAFRDRLDHMTKLRGRTRPTLIMHTRSDSLVDASHAARLSSCPGDNVRLVMFPHGDHNTIFAVNRERYLAELGQLVEVCTTGGPYESSGVVDGVGPGDDIAHATFDVWGEGEDSARSSIVARPAGAGIRIDASVLGAGHDWARSEVLGRESWRALVERVVDAVDHPPTTFGERIQAHAGRVELTVGGRPPVEYGGVGGKDDHARRVAVAVMRIVAAMGGPTDSILLPAEPLASQRRSPDDTLELGAFDPDATMEYDAPRMGLPDLLPVTLEMQVPDELLSIVRKRNGPGETLELDQQEREPDPEKK